MAFTGSRSLTIEGNAINNVGRDQYNLNNSFTRVVGTRVKRKQKKREDEYDQYREIIHGDIYKVEEIDSQNIWELKWETHKHRDSGDSFRRTTHHARLHGEGDKPYTVLTYQGRDALERWKLEFEQYLQLKSQTVPFWQLFGMNRSNVPALIFYDEWLPLSHLYDKYWNSFWSNIYVQMLSQHLRCYAPCLWFNSRNGYLSAGLSGPLVLWPHDEGSWGFDDYNDSVPSTVDMLEPATFIRYLSGEATTRDKLDIQVVRGVVHQEGFMVMSVSRGWDDKIVSRSYKELETCSGPGSVPPPPLKWCKDSDGFWRRTECYGAFEFLEHLRFDAAYSPITWQEIGRVCREDLPRSSWTTSYGDIFCKKELVGELTRFSIDLEKLWTNSDTSGMPGMSIYTTGPGVLSHAWLSQASYILDENDSGDMEPYVLPTPYIRVTVKVKAPMVPQNHPASANSVPYLFIRPPPLQVKDVEDWANSQISWWSFDNNGATEIPESTCQQLGLINPILDSVGVRLVHWSKPGVKAHDIIHAWQVARGFDPKTPDFARHLGFPIIERTAPRKTPKVEAVEDTNPEPELQESDSILSWWRAGRRVLKDFLTSIIV